MNKTFGLIGAVCMMGLALQASAIDNREPDWNMVDGIHIKWLDEKAKELARLAVEERSGLDGIHYKIYGDGRKSQGMIMKWETKNELWNLIERTYYPVVSRYALTTTDKAILQDALDEIKIKTNPSRMKSVEDINEIAEEVDKLEKPVLDLHARDLAIQCIENPELGSMRRLRDVTGGLIMTDGTRDELLSEVDKILPSVRKVILVSDDKNEMEKNWAIADKETQKPGRIPKDWLPEHLRQVRETSNSKVGAGSQAGASKNKNQKQLYRGKPIGAAFGEKSR